MQGMKGFYVRNPNSDFLNLQNVPHLGMEAIVLGTLEVQLDVDTSRYLAWYCCSGTLAPHYAHLGTVD